MECSAPQACILVRVPDHKEWDRDRNKDIQVDATKNLELTDSAELQALQQFLTSLLSQNLGDSGFLHLLRLKFQMTRVSPGAMTVFIRYTLLRSCNQTSHKGHILTQPD